MPRRFLAILLLLALAATAYAQTTTTPLGLIALRLETFRGEVGDNGDPSLGRLFNPITFRLQKSAFCLQRATILCRGTEPPPGGPPRIVPNENHARAKLRQCERSLAVVLAKLRSRYARRIIPPETVAALASETGGIASDLKAARESLTCPR